MTNVLGERSQSFQIKTLQESGGISQEQFELAQERYQYKTFWTRAANCILAVWLITNPLVFNYHSDALVVSDVAAGLSILLIELLSFGHKRMMLRWLTPVAGLWLLFAPLIFWSPSPAVYSVDTLVGCCVIAFSFLIPGAPGQSGIEMTGPDQPPGWTYNPSSWIRRWLGIALAVLGFVISRYLAARQLGYFDLAYDPFFGTGTDHVLHSSVSRAFPISDAGFGSIAYMLEVMTGFMGDRARWRTSPWIVTMFALLVLPLGATSIVLVILQPMVVGYWCGLCLITAAALLTSVPLAVHELIAMGQFMVAAKNQKKNLWNIFWNGGAILGDGNVDPDRTRYNFYQRWIASVQGVTVPMTLALQMLLGIGLMAQPDLMQTNSGLADCNHILGALTLTIAAVATAEVTRAVRFLNIPVAALLILGVFIFGRDIPVAMVSELVIGVILLATSLPRGEILEKYAGWDRMVF